MAYHPNPAGPRNIRELYHWVWAEFRRVGTTIGDLPTGRGSLDGGLANSTYLPDQRIDGGNALGEDIP